jgi:hypothetical protein
LTDYQLIRLCRGSEFPLADIFYLLNALIPGFDRHDNLLHNGFLLVKLKDFTLEARDGCLGANLSYEFQILDPVVVWYVVFLPSQL